MQRQHDTWTTNVPVKWRVWYRDDVADDEDRSIREVARRSGEKWARDNKEGE